MTPPRLAGRLLEWFCRDELLEEIRGDLDESFLASAAENPLKARLKYWSETLLFFRLHTLRRRRTRRSTTLAPIMWRNYLHVALRSMRKSPGYTSVNVLGLAAGLAATFLIAVYVQDELSYDKYHENGDRMYRLVVASDDQDFDGIAKVNGAWGTTAARELPAIGSMTRFVYFGAAMFEYRDLKGQDYGGFYADSTVFDVFSWPLLSGNPETALIEPNSLVVTESFAEQYFGQPNPFGEVIRVGGTTDYRVTGVMPDVPTNSHFVPTFLASMSSYTHESHDDWVAWNQYYTYMTLRQDAEPAAVTAGITDMLGRNMAPEQVELFTPVGLQPLGDIYLRSNMFREISAMGDIDTVAIFSVLALLILLIAAVNFVNLATARSSSRAKEVGLRKSMGAHRSALLRQFLGESVLTVLLASVLAIGLVLLALPTFNTMAGKAFLMSDLFTPRLLRDLGLAILTVGILAGFYPALVLSSFQPARVIKGRASLSGGVRLRRVLVTAQFVISAALIVGTGVVSDQLTYLDERPLGFDRESLASFSIPDQTLRDRYPELKAAVESVPGVEMVSLSGNRPGGGDWGIPIEIPGLDRDQIPPVRMLVGDHDYTQAYGIQVAAGRTFDVARPTDATDAVLINREMASQLAWEQPVGERILMPAVGREFTVIGVMEDFHFRSVHEAIGPLMLFSAPPNWYSMMNIRFGAGDVQAAVDGVREAYARFDAENPIVVSFIDQRFDSLYASDRQVAELLRIATILAILVACLGLLGLAAYTAQRRTKEIGVRKVIGASSSGIVALLTRETAILVGVALVAAIPLAIYFADSWLETFAYHTRIQVSTVAVGALIAAVLAIGTSGLQAWRAALLDPARALRSE